MLCEFDRLIYPSTPAPDSYMVALYRPCERIKDRAGNVLDKELEKPLEVKGITQNKLEKIRESYQMNRGARDVILLPKKLLEKYNRKW